MFTGLVSDLGSVRQREELASGRGARLQLETSLVEQIALGDSVAVNGVCLTAVDVDDNTFSAEAMGETLDRTSLAALASGDQVNLELAMRAGDRLGGHIVLGHVDGTASVVASEPDGISQRLTFSVDQALLRYVVKQGSVTLDGVSLTVVDESEDTLTVALIPETRERTNLGRLGVGDIVNVEVDVLAKHVEKLVQTSPEKSKS